ncbi:MAG: hypothetical protein AB1505_00235 [Candidatus Latescibacterota bacterium]
MRVAGVVTLCLAAAAAGLGDRACAEAADDAEEALALHGFLLGLLSGRTTGEEPPDRGDYVLGESRLRLELGGALGSASSSFLAKADLFHDGVAHQDGVEIREAYAAYAAGPLDLRAGRLIGTWGVGDLLFVNDVFPKDWESLFAGRPLEYLKPGVDGVQVRFSSSALNTEGFAIPFFTPDRLPSAARFVLGGPLAGLPAPRRELPVPRFRNAELALRIYRQVAGCDASLYAYRGFWRTPSLRVDSSAAPAAMAAFYPRLSVYGASAQRGLAAGAASLEAGYYHSRDDRGGSDPATPNSQWRLLAGYQRQVAADLTAGLQIYGEVMADYGAYRDSLPPPEPRQDRLRGVTSLRLTQLLRYQTWKLSLFAAYSPTDRDYFWQPEVSCRLSDNLGVWAGADVFGGNKETTLFGQFDRSDNGYLGTRFDF